MHLRQVHPLEGTITNLCRSVNSVGEYTLQEVLWILCNLWENNLSKKFCEFCEICGRHFDAAEARIPPLLSTHPNHLCKSVKSVGEYTQQEVLWILWNLWENIRSKSEICGRIFSAKTSVRSAYSVGDPLLRRRQDTSATMKICGRIYAVSVDSVGGHTLQRDGGCAAYDYREAGMPLPHTCNSVTS